MWQRFFLGGLTVLAMLVFQQSGTLAQGNFSDDYPGTGEEMIISIADTQVAQGARCFYKAYGRFPQSWAEVEEQGISSSNLLGYRMQPIDPDDSQLEFSGDVHYEFNAGQAIVHTMDLHGEVNDLSLQVPGTYTSRFEDFIASGKLSEEQVERFHDYAANEAQLLQFAILGNISRSIRIYQDVHGSPPDSLTQFFASGISPVNENTINPLTGQPFRYDGSAGDVRIEFTDTGMVIVRHVDAEGVEMPFFDYFF